MNRRFFIKSLFFFIASFPLKISSFNKKRSISFDYSVASGDPTNTHVILWTKVTPLEKINYEVKWEISSDTTFNNIISNGLTTAKYFHDYTVKVDARVPNDFNGKKVFYRFTVGDVVSDTGITSTLPIENPSTFNISFCSCSNYPAGYFNAYKEMANNSEIDLVLHLGDYLYEYSSSGYASSDAKEMGRVVDPRNEIISLADYRKRYATYRKDVDLQVLHQNKPFIVVWDDHEITNDTWKDGAQNHNFGEGTFKARKYNALKAYYEWMPIREAGDKEKIWRSFSIGNLVNLMMLDTRLYGREEQLNISSYLNGESLDKKGFKEDLAKPRDLLGNEQMNWISKTIDKKYKWSIFGQQLLIGPKYLPSIFGTKEMDNSRSYLRKQLAGQELPINTDQWDGYPKERDKFYNVISESQSNIILAGDSHNSWFSNLYDKDEKFIGIEVGAPAISSPSFIDTFKDITKLVEDSFVAENRDLLWVNGKYKGYVSMNISEEFIDVSYKYVSTVKSREYVSLDPYTFRVEHNKPCSASNV